jgi:ketosteroid isomerase-like protein
MTPSGQSEAAQLVAALYEAFARGDVASVLAAFDSDIVWNEAENFVYASGNPYCGPQAILDGVFAPLATEWDGFAVHPESILSGGDRVVVTGRYRGVYKRTGKSVDSQFVHVWTLRGGRVTTFQQYTDTLQFARATGAV